MIVHRLTSVHALLAVLDEPEMEPVRLLLSEQGRFSTRRTWERRLAALSATLPAPMACLGHALVAELDPWANDGRAVASEGAVLRAKGGVWHKKDREAGVVPHTSIDTQAPWTTSGWHGGVYGWKLYLVTTVAAVWIPLAADLTPAHVADNLHAPFLVTTLPPDAPVVLGDQHYNDPTLGDLCTATNRVLVTTKRGAYPHTDDGVEVRRVFHQLRSPSIESFNAPLKGIFDCRGHVPTKGLVATRRFARGAVMVYQLALLHQFQTGASLRVGLKSLLKAA